jgi:hypothetical protein
MRQTTQLHYMNGDWPELTTTHSVNPYSGRTDMFTVNFRNTVEAHTDVQIFCDLDQLEEIADQLVEIVNQHRHDQRAAAVEAEVAELAEVES